MNEIAQSELSDLGCGACLHADHVKAENSVPIGL